MNPDQEEFLRRLTLNDETVAAATLQADLGPSDLSGLDSATVALVRIAALIATESALASYQWAVDSALAAGAPDRDIIDVLIAVVPVVGLARVTAAAPQLAVALGYEIDA